jgi:radical SAM-linked protein
VNLAAPLPLGFTSRGEIGDFWLSEVLPLPEIQNSLENALPPGLEIFKIQEISDLHGSKLPALVTASSYYAFLEEVTPDLTAKIGQLLESTSLPWSRKGKSFNLRKLIIKLEFAPENAAAANAIFMKLVHLPGATGRPEDVLNALGINHIVNLICRTKIDFKDGGN